MQVTLAQTESFLKKLHSKKIGSKDDLINEIVSKKAEPRISREEAENIYGQFCSAGIIHEGYDGTNKKRFQFAELGNEYFDYMSSWTEIEQEFTELNNKYKKQS